MVLKSYFNRLKLILCSDGKQYEFIFSGLSWTYYINTNVYQDRIVKGRVSIFISFSCYIFKINCILKYHVCILDTLSFPNTKTRMKRNSTYSILSEYRNIFIENGRFLNSDIRFRPYHSKIE